MDILLFPMFMVRQMLISGKISNQPYFSLDFDHMVLFIFPNSTYSTIYEIIHKI